MFIVNIFIHCIIFWRVFMGQVSKNSRVGSSTHKFLCPCGGEIKMKTVFANGKKKNYAECEKCKRQERKPSDFK